MTRRPKKDAESQIHRTKYDKSKKILYSHSVLPSTWHQELRMTTAQYTSLYTTLSYITWYLFKYFTNYCDLKVEALLALTLNPNRPCSSGLIWITTRPWLSSDDNRPFTFESCGKQDSNVKITTHTYISQDCTGATQMLSISKRKFLSCPIKQKSQGIGNVLTTWTRRN